jgi:REP element-mobilizing transposase RayT
VPQSFAAVYLHYVFSTKNREPLIRPTWAKRLYKYLAGTARENGCALLDANGTADHVHLLVSLGREITIAKLVGTLKASSSRWVHDTFPDARRFAWQAGYGVFSVSESRLTTVKNYLARQAEHHRVRTFQDELRELYRKHRIDWDERHVWD